MAELAQYLGTGKRKTSVARVILRPGDGTTWINGRTIEDYFPRAIAPRAGARAAQGRRRSRARYDLRVRVHGGGPSGQAGAVRHGIARALVEADPELRVAAQARGLPDARRAASSSARRPACTRRARRRSSPSASRASRGPAAYFGTDGVRGVVGET